MGRASAASCWCEPSPYRMQEVAAGGPRRELQRRLRQLALELQQTGRQSTGLSHRRADRRAPGQTRRRIAALELAARQSHPRRRLKPGPPKKTAGARVVRRFANTQRSVLT
jgi:hypothetical protein